MNGGGVDYWIIEGIGNAARFLHDELWGPYHMGGMVCHTLGGIPDYESFPGEDWNCGCGANVSTNEIASSSLNVRPSPTAGMCYVQGAPPMAHFALFSVDGRMVDAGQCSQEGSAQLNMSALKSGVYVVTITDGIASQRIKVIKE